MLGYSLGKTHTHTHALTHTHKLRLASFTYMKAKMNAQMTE